MGPYCLLHHGGRAARRGRGERFWYWESTYCQAMAVSGPSLRDLNAAAERPACRRVPTRPGKEEFVVAFWLKRNTGGSSAGREADAEVVGNSVVRNAETGIPWKAPSSRLEAHEPLMRSSSISLIFFIARGVAFREYFHFEVLRRRKSSSIRMNGLDEGTP